MKIFELNIFGFTLAPSYYGLMYILGFLYGIWAIKRTKKYTDSQRESLFIYIFAWVILWGRIWYILFYNLENYLATPLDILKVWEWWMSFHGWVIWVIIALYLFSKKVKLSFLEITDDIAAIIPVALFFWRIWNYLNKELLWFAYSWPLAVTTQTGSYFPSPLVEALLEWIVLFFILRYFYAHKSFHGQIWSLFLIFYGIFRTLVEIFIRTPDEQIWYYFWFLTQWSLLSIPMILLWVFFYVYLGKNPQYDTK